MKIRLAKSDDYFIIKNLLEEDFLFSANKDEFIDYLNNHNILVLSKNNKDLACAIYELHHDIFANRKVLFVRYLCVKSDFRGKGIGKALIDEIKQIANDLKVDAIELTCADFRQNSHEFYLANDFSVKKTKIFICENFKKTQMGGGRAQNTIKHKNIA